MRLKLRWNRSNGKPNEPCLFLDEAVTRESCDGLGVELSELPGRVGNESESEGTALTERAFEPRLLPQGLVAPAA